MADASAIQPSPKKKQCQNSLTMGFNTLVSTQYWRMMAERIIPRAIPFVATLALTSGTLMSGSLASLPPSGKAAGLMLLGAATLVTGLRLLGTKLPSKLDAARRIDAVSPTEHQVAENIFKDLKNPSKDPVRRMHIDRLLNDVPKLITEDWRGSDAVKKVALPLLMPAALVLSLGAYTGYGDYEQNLRDSFNLALNVPPAPSSRINAWVMQPDYTGEFAPIILHDGTTAQPVASQPIDVIAGSVLTIQLFDDDTKILAETIDDDTDMNMDVTTRGRTREISVTLTEDTAINVSRGMWSGIDWSFNVTQDQAPTVHLDTILEGREGEDPTYRVIITDDFGADITDSKANVRGEDTRQRNQDEVTPLPQYRDNNINLGLN